MPFWRAALGYVPRRDSPAEDLIDAHDRDPAFWFEAMDEPRGDAGGAIHLAVWLPTSRPRRDSRRPSPPRHLVRDRAPMWWTVADSAGNEIDISTTKNRD